jgi:peptidoglycan/LPS O-acetylase OafA/YrhL
VFIQHQELWAHGFSEDAASYNNVFEMGFGFEGRYSWVAFPGIRIFFTGGHFAVSVFYAISGYVLSAKAMSLLQSGELVRMGDALASALFRRWLRLWIPLAVTTFGYMLMWWLLPVLAGLIGLGGAVEGKPNVLWVIGAEPQGSFRDELWHWYAEFKNFSFIFNHGGLPWLSYNFHTWSIPVEMRGSIIIYTALLAFSRLTTRARLLGQLVLMFYFMYIVDGWYGSLFIAGMLLCDLDLLAAKGELPTFLVRLEPYKKLIFYHLFAISIYLGGIPSRVTDVADLRLNHGWYYLSFLTPQAVFDYKWFFLFWAATLLVACVPRLPWLRRFFESRFCQYLGRISYALYLIHGPVLWILGDRLYAAAGWHIAAHREHIPGWVDAFKLPRTGPLGMEIAFLVPQLIIVPVTFWLADVVTRYVDEPAVRFAGRLYAWVLPQPGEK